ncbi:MAG: WYL domain-containing protein [Lentisphaerae bacterium]|nr:WYL domain-containing protein [Lentisphaerota bacterium]
MKRGKTQFRRLLEIDRLIRDGKYPNCVTFAREWGVTQKTVQRDMDYLRDQLGAPIEYDREKRGYHYTSTSWFLPALTLSEGELLDLLVASRALDQYRGVPVAKHLERTFSKIAEALPREISLHPELAYAQFTFMSPPARPIQERSWIALVRGVQNHRMVRFTYRSLETGKAKERVVMPYHIANLQGEWYAFGPEVAGAEIRQFSIARMEKATLTKLPFTVPADFNPETMLAHTFGRFVIAAKPQTVQLLFDKEIVPWVLERQWHQSQTIKRLRNGDIELSFQAAGLFEVFRWVLAWGRYVHVLAPAELVQMIRDEVRLMACPPKPILKLPNGDIRARVLDRMRAKRQAERPE